MKAWILLAVSLLLTGCATALDIPEVSNKPYLMPRSATYQDLIALPEPAGKMLVGVYDFRDQTGQYKASPNSNFSTAVPQGAASLLSQSLLDSRWFTPLEREGLQNLLTERKIIRAAQGKQADLVNFAGDLPALSAASLVIEGGIVAYDSNIRTGGAGARYLGIGASGQYQVDQVSVNVRAVDVRTGKVLLSITTSKTILSKELESGVFKFIDYKDLLEAELGYTTNEPVNLALMSAIDAAVIHLITSGIENGLWNLRDPQQANNEIIQKYMSTERQII
ncbi:MAG: CsgG/HfaB family protein [Vibrio sp.]